MELNDILADILNLICSRIPDMSIDAKRVFSKNIFSIRAQLNSYKTFVYVTNGIFSPNNISIEDKFPFVLLFNMHF